MRRTLGILALIVAVVLTSAPLTDLLDAENAAVDPAALNLTFDASLGGLTLNLPFSGGSGVTIDWGDGTIDSSLSHTYAASATYSISVTGSATSFGTGMAHTGFPGITRVDSYGALGLTNLSSAFGGATNLTDLPNLPSTITDTSWMLSGASSYNESVSDWDTSNVTTMEGMFSYAPSFNNGCAAGVTTCPLDPNGSKWDTSKVTNFVSMFNVDDGSSIFNQRVTGLNLSSATAMHYMFRGTDAFNNGCASGVFTCPMTSTATSWNPGNVVNFAHMFMDATGFNQTISGMDIHSAGDLTRMFWRATSFNNGCPAGTATCPMTATSWDTSKVVHASEMLQEASAFNQDVSTWDLRSLVVGFRMFQSTSLSMSNYNRLLVHLVTLPLQTGASFGAVPTQYGGTAAIAAHDTLTAAAPGGFAWVIADGGPGTQTTFPSTISAITPTTGTYTAGDTLTVGSTVAQTDAGTACTTTGAAAPTYTLDVDPTTGTAGSYALSAGIVSTSDWDSGAYTMTIAYPGDGTCEAAQDSTTVITIVEPSAPAIPGSVTGLRGERKITVSWTPPATDGGSTIVGYLVEIKLGAGAWKPAGGGCAPWNTSWSTALTCQATRLDNVSTYQVRVSAINAIGKGEPTTSLLIWPRIVR